MKSLTFSAINLLAPSMIVKRTAGEEDLKLQQDAGFPIWPYYPFLSILLKLSEHYSKHANSNMQGSFDKHETWFVEALCIDILPMSNGLL